MVKPGSATSVDDADGYRLKKSSPALGSGVRLPQDAARDFFGNRVPAAHPNMGAYQGPGV